jgi:hypothetical protein
MGAGINTTFRQVGIATGIAGLGSVFIDRVGAATDAGLSRLGSVPADMATRVADGLSSGRAAETLGSLPPSIRAQAQEVARGAVATGLNDIFLIAAVVAFAGALASLLLVRSRDVAPARDTAGPARPDVGTGLRRRSTAGVPAAGSR